MPIGLPPTFKENLSTKPPIQTEFLADLNNLWLFAQSNGALFYARFYAYLTALADTHVMQILDAVEAHGFTESTLIIRIADHGEMAMSHGGLRQKDYTAYEEVIRIPMVFSNPILFPKPLETDCPAGLIDLLPTLVTVAGLEGQKGQWALQGATSRRCSGTRTSTCRTRSSSPMTTSSEARHLPVQVTSGAFGKRTGNSRCTLRRGSSRVNTFTRCTTSRTTRPSRITSPSASCFRGTRRNTSGCSKS